MKFSGGPIRYKKLHCARFYNFQKFYRVNARRLARVSDDNIQEKLGADAGGCQRDDNRV